MPTTDVDPNALTLALILTAAGVVPASALVTGLVSLLGNLGSIVTGRERILAFIFSAVLVVFAYVATAVSITAVTGFGAFLAWYGIARLSMANYDDIKGKANSLTGPVAATMVVGSTLILAILAAVILNL